MFEVLYHYTFNCYHTMLPGPHANLYSTNYLSHVVRPAGRDAGTAYWYRPGSNLAQIESNYFLIKMNSTSNACAICG